MSHAAERCMHCNLVAGAASGAAAALLTCPLDMLKIRMQAGARGSPFTIARDVLRTEGIRGLYRGLTPTLIGLVPSWTIYFAVYNLAKRLMVDMLQSDGPLVHITASALAGVSNNLFLNPVWVMRTRLVTQENHYYRNMFSGMIKVAREEGIRALYRGIGASMLGVSHVVVQFPLYEFFKRTLAEKRGASIVDLTPLEALAASTASKVIASIAAYPHEVVRTRLMNEGRHRAETDQRSHHRMLAIVKRVWRDAGFRGFYRGLAANLPRVVIQCGVTFTAFEMALRFAFRFSQS